MIINPKDQITTPQAAVVVINFILGTGILTLPRASVEKVKTPDVWITVILGGVIAMIAGVIIVKLSQQFPEKTFFNTPMILLENGWVVYSVYL
jgi:spore germination protein